MANGKIHEGALEHEEIMPMLQRWFRISEIDYSQSMHMSWTKDMTVGRYMWRDDEGVRRTLFVLEDFAR